MICKLPLSPSYTDLGVGSTIGRAVDGGNSRGYTETEYPPIDIRIVFWSRRRIQLNSRDLNYRGHY